MALFSVDHILGRMRCGGYNLKAKAGANCGAVSAFEVETVQEENRNTLKNKR